MRKGRDGGKKTGKKREKIDENSGHYVIARSQPSKRQLLECRTLVPIKGEYLRGVETILHSQNDLKDLTADTQTAYQIGIY